MQIKNAHNWWSYLAQSQNDPSVEIKPNNPSHNALIGITIISGAASHKLMVWSIKNVFLINQIVFDANSYKTINIALSVPTTIHNGMVKQVNASATKKEIMFFADTEKFRVIS
jgi:hypothetical protein